MSLYPERPSAGQTLQTDVTGLTVDKGFLAHVNMDNVLAADDDRYVAAATDMKVGAYTLANTTPGDGHAHNVIVTHTATAGTDTLGTITVAGTNIADEAISEEITPLDGTVAAGAKAFASITSITGAGWVVNAGADKIKIGFGDVIGLPYLGSTNSVLFAALGGTREGTAPTVVRDADEIEKNTIDLNSALNGTDVDIWLIV